MPDPSTTSSGRELESRVALVTGAARNIGREIALALARGGASVVVHTKSSRSDAEATAEAVRAAGGAAAVVLADLADPAGCRALVDEAVAAYGRLDILVNNAATRGDRGIPEITLEDWRSVMSSILDGTFFLTQAAIPHLKASDAGAVINIGGVAGETGVSGRAHVSAAKAGVMGLTRAMAAELAADGITVNCVSPGRVETRRAHLPPHFAERQVPLGRGAEPWEIAAAVRFLAGPGARYITGQVLPVNGGWHIA
jgi:3-oxoacyl-[acyl-carrier protein] reductase